MIRNYLFIGCALLPSIATAAPLPFPGDSLPGVDIGNGLGAGYETSGIVWHSGFQKYIAVNDQGAISSMDINGNNVNHYGLGGDLEGVTVADHSSNFVYVGRENGNSIVEFNIAGGWPARAFGLHQWMPVSGNSGLEALTFVADPTHPEGGLFYAGHQGNGNIYAFSLPIASSTTSQTVTFEFSFQAAPGRTDLSGLHYDATHDVLYAIWDSSNYLRAMRPDGTFLEEWFLPGRRQEGITFQGTNLVIAQDNGPDAIRYASFPIIVPEPTSLALCLSAIALLTTRRRRS
jgi:uncharacterized protein YjiK